MCVCMCLPIYLSMHVFIYVCVTDAIHHEDQTLRLACAVELQQFSLLTVYECVTDAIHHEYPRHGVDERAHPFTMRIRRMPCFPLMSVRTRSECTKYGMVLLVEPLAFKWADAVKKDKFAMENSVEGAWA
jgi:hypothetical protein